MNDKRKQHEQLIALLGVGVEEARAAYDLAIDLGTDHRGVRLAVAAARMDGIPICASRKGYYLASTQSELQATVRYFQRTAVSMSMIAEVLGKAKPIKGGERVS